MCRVVTSESRRAAPDAVARIARAAQQALVISASAPISDRDHELVIEACRAALRGHAALPPSSPRLLSSGLLVAAAALALAGAHSACRRGFLRTHVAEAGSLKPVEAVGAALAAIIDCVGAWERTSQEVQAPLPGAAASALSLLAACSAVAAHLPVVSRRWAPRMAVFCFRAAELSPPCAAAASATAGALIRLLAWANVEKPRRGGGGGGGASVGTVGSTAAAPRSTIELHVYLLPLLGAVDGNLNALRACASGAAAGAPRALPWDAAALHVLLAADASGHRVASDVRMAELGAAAGAAAGGGGGGGAAAAAPAAAPPAAATPSSIVRPLLFLLRVIEATVSGATPGSGPAAAGPPGAHAVTLPLAGLLHASAVACDPRVLQDARVPADAQLVLCAQGVRLGLAAVAAGGPHVQRFRTHVLLIVGSLVMRGAAAASGGGGAPVQLRVLAATLLPALAGHCSLAALPAPLAAVVRRALLACVGVVEGAAALPPAADGLLEGALAVLRSAVCLQRQGGLGDDVRYAIDRAAALTLRPPPAAAVDAELAQGTLEALTAAAKAGWGTPPQAAPLEPGALTPPLLPRGHGPASARVRAAQLSLLAVCIDTPWTSGRRSALLPALLETARGLGLRAWAGAGTVFGGLAHAAPSLAELADGVALARAPREDAAPAQGSFVAEPAAAGAPLAMHVGGRAEASAAATATPAAVALPFGSVGWAASAGGAAAPDRDRGSDDAAPSPAEAPSATLAPEMLPVSAGAGSAGAGMGRTAAAPQPAAAVAAQPAMADAGEDDDFPDIVA